jgi:hypothetical protein
MLRSDFNLEPISKVTEPESGQTVFVDRYWFTINDNVLVYNRHGKTYQHNAQRKVLETMLPKYQALFEDEITIQQIPLAYYYVRD